MGPKSLTRLFTHEIEITNYELRGIIQGRNCRGLWTPLPQSLLADLVGYIHIQFEKNYIMFIFNEKWAKWQ